MSNILECNGLTKIFHKKTVLNVPELTLSGGKIIGLMGPNGSGKTTLIKLAAGLLTPSNGSIKIDGNPIGIETKKIVSYLPERTYLDNSLNVNQTLNFFSDFYSDFSKETALDMLDKLNIDPKQKLRTMSKGTKEKVQLILVMSRRAKLYLLDEPMGGVDPAARDYIIDTILSNYNPESTIIISSHLISDIEKIIDQVIFIKYGDIILNQSVDSVRAKYNQSIDNLFREMFKC